MRATRLPLGDTLSNHYNGIIVLIRDDDLAPRPERLEPRSDRSTGSSLPDAKTTLHTKLAQTCTVGKQYGLEKTEYCPLLVSACLQATSQNESAKCIFHMQISAYTLVYS